MTPTDAILDIFGKALVSRLTGLLELRKPILYTEQDSRKGGQFGRRFGKISANVKVEVPLTYRKAFLWGCANHVKNLDYEVMLLGFGRTQGTRNTITSIMRIEGEKHSVSPTPEAQAAIAAHLAADTRNSILLVHNHPEHILSSALALFLGPEPLPSLTDRNTALAVLIHRLQKLMGGNHHGDVRFFLVQNDEVSEFSGLNAGTVVDALRQFGPGFVARQ